MADANAGREGLIYKISIIQHSQGDLIFVQCNLLVTNRFEGSFNFKKQLPGLKTTTLTKF